MSDMKKAIGEPKKKAIRDRIKEYKQHDPAEVRRIASTIKLTDEQIVEAVKYIRRRAAAKYHRAVSIDNDRRSGELGMRSMLDRIESRFMEIAPESYTAFRIFMGQPVPWMDEHKENPLARGDLLFKKAWHLKYKMLKIAIYIGKLSRPSLELFDKQLSRLLTNGNNLLTTNS